MGIRLPHLHYHGDDPYFLIDAELDTITCPACRVCVTQGHVCGCPMRISGPGIEGVARKTLTGELSAKE